MEFLGKLWAGVKRFLKITLKIGNVGKKHDNAKKKLRPSSNWVLRETDHASDKFLDNKETADKFQIKWLYIFKVARCIRNSTI